MRALAQIPVAVDRLESRTNDSAAHRSDVLHHGTSIDAMSGVSQMPQEIITAPVGVEPDTRP